MVLTSGEFYLYLKKLFMDLLCLDLKAFSIDLNKQYFQLCHYSYFCFDRRFYSSCYRYHGIGEDKGFDIILEGGTVTIPMDSRFRNCGKVSFSIPNRGSLISSFNPIGFKRSCEDGRKIEIFVRNLEIFLVYQTFYNPNIYADFVIWGDVRPYVFGFLGYSHLRGIRFYQGRGSDEFFSYILRNLEKDLLKRPFYGVKTKLNGYFDKFISLLGG